MSCEKYIHPSGPPQSHQAIEHFLSLETSSGSCSVNPSLQCGNHWPAFDHCRLDLFSWAFHVNTPSSFLSLLSSPLPHDPFCKMSKQEGPSIWRFLSYRKKRRPPRCEGFFFFPQSPQESVESQEGSPGSGLPFLCLFPHFPYLSPPVWLEV